LFRKKIQRMNRDSRVIRRVEVVSFKISAVIELRF
jgi:hypothetical protein